LTTLKDVARAAGVSTATVSRVLSNTGYVSDEIRKRVQKAIDKLHYQPNGIARSLRSAKTHTVGVLVPDISNPYFMEIIRSVENVLSKENYNILVASSDEHPDKERKLLEVFFEKRVDGIILATSHLKDSEFMADFTNSDVPLVLVDRSIDGIQIDTIAEENESSSSELVKYLIAVGHRKIAIINGSAPISTVNERRLGFEKTLKEHGINVPDEYIQEGQFDVETGYLSGKRLLKMDNPPTAIFCCNNFIAIGLMMVINELKLSIPEDVSIVSFGELLLPELIRPKLTAIIQDPERIGRIAGRLLLDRLNGNISEIAENITLQPHIRLGESVKIIGVPAQ
jgi:LacI family transcriptional regulator